MNYYYSSKKSSRTLKSVVRSCKNVKRNFPKTKNLQTFWIRSDATNEIVDNLENSTELPAETEFKDRGKKSLI